MSSLFNLLVISTLQLILFATSDDSEKFYPIFTEAAKVFKGKVRNYLSVCFYSLFLLYLFTKICSTETLCLTVCSSYVFTFNWTMKMLENQFQSTLE